MVLELYYSALYGCDSTPKNNLLRGGKVGLFWLMVPEVPIHGRLVPWLLAAGLVGTGQQGRSPPELWCCWLPLPPALAPARPQAVGGAAHI